MQELKTYIRFAPWNDDVEVVTILKTHANDRYYYRITEHKFDIGEEPKQLIDHSISENWTPQTTQFLQSFLDAAWEIGLRPKGYKTQEQIDAIKYHLEDMRKLVFKGK
jgi:hypothetical protein